MIHAERHAHPGYASALVPLAAAWGFLLLLWLAGTRLPQLPPWGVLLLMLTLAALPACGLWLGFMIRKRVYFRQFSDDGRLRRWLAGGWWPATKAIATALALTTVALWQAWFLAPREWLLLAAAPPLYVALAWGLQSRLAAEFAEPAFAWTSVQRASRWIFTIILGALWLGLMLPDTFNTRTAHPAMPAATLDQAIVDIAAARSGLVRWGLDGLLALQVASSAVRDLPQSTALRIALLALSGPGAMLWGLACVMQGASGLRRPLWRAARLKPSGGQRAAVRVAGVAFVAALLLFILLPPIAESLDGLAGKRPSPLALQRLPQCERIAGDYYTVGTALQLRQVALQALGQTQAAAAFCTQTRDMGPALDAALDRYLDWYFSLGAEWGRIFHLLTGNAEQFMEQHLQQALQDTPELTPWLQAVRTRELELRLALARGEERLQQTLQAHRLVLDTGHCLVQDDLGELPELRMLTSVRQRLAVSTASGVGAGAFAGVVAAKAMSKAGMKAAAKVLAKQGLGKAGAIAAGAALGSIVPGAGTAAGAVAGAALGTLVGAGLDWTALRLEEHVTREGMKAELQAALHEHMAAVAGALGCGDEAAPPAPAKDAAAARP